MSRTSDTLNFERARKLIDEGQPKKAEEIAWTQVERAEEAVEDYSDAVTQGRLASAYSEASAIFIKTANLDAAYECIEKALAIYDYLESADEQLRDLHLRAGRINQVREQHEEAAASFREALAVAEKLPDSRFPAARIYSYLARSLEALGLIEEAKQTLQEGLLAAKASGSSYDEQKLGAKLDELLEAEEGGDLLDGIGVDDAEDRESETLEEILEEIDSLIGLEAAKRGIRRMANFMQVQQLRAQVGHTPPPISQHVVYLGSSGTGKTTLARYSGRIAKALGALKTANVVEVSRGELIGEHVGQTAPLVNEVVDRALDGVLFIDEAYSLLPEDSTNDYGHEAITTLMTRMENDRDRLMVILAGYPGPMRTFLKANPGLSSRFSSSILFEDYLPEELQEIFEKFVADAEYALDEDALTLLPEIMERSYIERNPENFGNARAVRNFFEETIANQADRLAPLLTELSVEERGRLEELRPDVAKVLSLICAGDLPERLGQADDEEEE